MAPQPRQLPVRRESRQYVLMACASRHSRDPVRLAQFADCTVGEAARYLCAAGLQRDHRVPGQYLRAGVSPGDHAERLCRVADELHALCGSANRTHRFMEPVVHGRAWNERNIPQTPVTGDMSTYVDRVVRATGVWCARYGSRIAGWQNLTTHREVVVQYDLTVHDGWGRGLRQVPWQMIAHPANVRILPRPARDASWPTSSTDPDALLLTVRRWNRVHGPAVLDVNDMGLPRG